MKLPVAPVLLAAALAVATGCSDPAFTPAKVQMGMTEEQAVAALGRPTATVVQGATTYLEYETYDQDRWFGDGRKENLRIFVVRLNGGRVDAVGKKGEFDYTRGPSIRTEGARKPGAGAAGPGPFDLRTELEKLETLKKDGLITESEYRDLRQRVMDKARLQ